MKKPRARASLTRRREELTTPPLSPRVLLFPRLVRVPSTPAPQSPLTAGATAFRQVVENGASSCDGEREGDRRESRR